MTLDAGSNATLDLSDSYSQSALVWRSDILPYGSHSLKVTCLGQGGNVSQNATVLSVAGFWTQTAPIQNFSCPNTAECLL